MDLRSLSLYRTIEWETGKECALPGSPAVERFEKAQPGITALIDTQ